MTIEKNLSDTFSETMHIQNGKLEKTEQSNGCCYEGNWRVYREIKDMETDLPFGG